MENLKTQEHVQVQSTSKSKDLHKLKSIRNLGISGLVCLIILIALIGGYLIYHFLILPGTTVNQGDVWKWWSTLKFILIVGGPLFFASSVLTVSGLFSMMWTHWADESLNNKKSFWGLMGFLFLGPIALIVFGCSKI